VGSLTAGWFRKEIKDFIFNGGGDIIGTGPDNGYDGLYEGFSLTMPHNGGMATIEGYELSYQQQYTFLPGLLKGLGAYANYTKIQTNGDYGTGSPRATGTVPGFVPETANLGVSYSYGRFSVRAKWNYKTAQLTVYNDDPAQLRYLAESKRVDLNFRVRINSHINVFADLINVTGTPIKYERGAIGRIDWYQNNGRRAVLGLSGRY
jgi:TonB-dependent receptor